MPQVMDIIGAEHWRESAITQKYLRVRGLSGEGRTFDLTWSKWSVTHGPA